MSARQLRLPLIVGFIMCALVTLGLKWIFEDRVDYDKLYPVFMERIAHALEADGFTLLAQTDTRTVSGYKDECFVWIGSSRAEGGGDDLFIQSYGTLGELSFWYKGDLFAERPVLAPLVDKYRERLKIALFQTPSVHQIYHIISTSSCKPEELRTLALDGAAAVKS